MKILNVVTEAISPIKMDQRNGIGSTPSNADVDYFGLRVWMRPTTFFALIDEDVKDWKQRDVDRFPFNLNTYQFLNTSITDNKAGLGSPFFSVAFPGTWVQLLNTYPIDEDPIRLTAIEPLS